MGERFGFAGAYTDRSGLSYMNARYYNPATGSFLSRDPVQGVLGGSSISFNPYPYANNNPVNFTDPTGESPLLLVGLFLLGVGIEAGTQYAFEGEITHPWMLPVSGALNVGGYSFGKAAFKLGWSARNAFIAGSIFDVGLSAAADIHIRGDSFSTAFWGNVAGIGIGEVAGFAGRGAFRLGGRALRSTGSALQDAGRWYSRTFDLNAVGSGPFPILRRRSPLQRPSGRGVLSPIAHTADARVNLERVWPVPTSHTIDGRSIWEAHHIVPQEIRQAQSARKILEDFDIALDSPANLVWLPGDSKAYDFLRQLRNRSFDPVPLAHRGSGIHTFASTPRNVLQVNRLLNDLVQSGANRADILKALNDIGNSYLMGNLP